MKPSFIVARMMINSEFSEGSLRLGSDFFKRPHDHFRSKQIRIMRTTTTQGAKDILNELIDVTTLIAIFALELNLISIIN